MKIPTIINQLLKPILALVMTLFVMKASSQDFTFKKDVASYKSLEEFTIINDNSDSFHAAYNMGLNTDFNNQFNFSFFGLALDLDSVLIGKSGFAIFISKDGTKAIAVDPFVARVKKHDSNSQIVHGIKEENGKKYYVIEWKNIEYEEVPGKIGSFQIIIENTSGHVSFHYGPTTVPKNTSSEGVQCGLFLVKIDFSTVYRMSVVQGNPNNPSESSTSFGYITTYPESETRFNFTNEVLSSQPLSNGLSTVSVYPNPSNGSLNIKLGATYKSVELSILNQMGQVMVVQNFENTSLVQTDLALESGLYYLQIKSGNQITRKRVLIN